MIRARLSGQVNSGAFGEAWVPDDLNGGHLELYFFLLAGLVAVRYENRCRFCCCRHLVRWHLLPPGRDSYLLFLNKQFCWPVVFVAVVVVAAVVSVVSVVVFVMTYS